MNISRKLLLLVSLLLAARAQAVMITTDGFDTSSDGWLDRDPGKMVVSYDPTFGDLALGSLKGAFATQTLAFVQTDAFRATNTTFSGAFTGNYWATNFSAYTFSFYADTVLPSDLYVRFNGNGSTFFLNAAGQVNNVGAWTTVNIPLSYSFGWVGGTAAAFSNALSNVQYVDVELTRNGTTAQNYWLDNFSLTDMAINMVPEPGSGALAVGGLVLLASRNRIRRFVGMRPAKRFIARALSLADRARLGSTK